MSWHAGARLFRGRGRPRGPSCSRFIFPSGAALFEKMKRHRFSPAPIFSRMPPECLDWTTGAVGDGQSRAAQVIVPRHDELVSSSTVWFSPRKRASKNCKHP